MRAIEEILKEVQTECTKDNCQSWNTIAILAMERAIKESKEDIITELEKISNNANILIDDNYNTRYAVYKSGLDKYINQLDSEL
jgi:hypothetical protein